MKVVFLLVTALAFSISAFAAGQGPQAVNVLDGVQIEMIVQAMQNVNESKKVIPEMDPAGISCSIFAGTCTLYRLENGKTLKRDVNQEVSFADRDLLMKFAMAVNAVAGGTSGKSVEHDIAGIICGRALGRGLCMIAALKRD